MSAAAQLPVSVSEYLDSSYRPDCDYVDGIIEERNLGEFDHAAMQRALLRWFLQQERTFGLVAYPELRIQASPSRFRVADICVLAASAPREQVIQTPPVAVIEILSPADRVARYMERLQDYRSMGIPNIWIVDPGRRCGFDFSSGQWRQTTAFTEQATGLHLDLSALFTSIDQDLH